MHLCTDVTAASLMLEPLGEVGGDVHRDKIFEKMMGYKTIAKN